MMQRVSKPEPAKSWVPTAKPPSYLRINTKAWLAPRLPKPPRIQFYLQQATELRKHLDNTPGFTQIALANELGISRFELIHNLNLLKLTPEIRKFLMDLPPTTQECSITKKKLRRVSSIKGHNQQRLEFNRLLESMGQVIGNNLGRE